MGERIGKRLSNESILDMIPLADDTNIVEMHTPRSWIGKNIIDLKARSRFGINIIGFKIDGKLTTNFDPKQELKETDIILVIGKEEDINKVNG